MPVSGNYLFLYRNVIQTVTITTAGIYDITAFGAQDGAAGYGTGATGGYGAEAEGSFCLAHGTVLDIIAGGEGGTVVGQPSGGGGGGSFVINETTGQKLVIAGGGRGGYRTNGMRATGGKSFQNGGGRNVFRGVYCGTGWVRRRRCWLRWWRRWRFVRRGPQRVCQRGHEHRQRLRHPRTSLLPARHPHPDARGRGPRRGSAHRRPRGTRFGGIQAIKWIGRQSHDARFVGTDRERLPVCIRAGALGERLPARDLYVSPGHSMLVDGSLILARNLINGLTIMQDWSPPEIHYFQIELDVHDCVLAEGTWSETYADGPGLRAAFHNAAQFDALYPDHAPPRDLIPLCAPRPEQGANLDTALRPVVARAAAGLHRVEGSVVVELTGDGRYWSRRGAAWVDAKLARVA